MSGADEARGRVTPEACLRQSAKEMRAFDRLPEAVRARLRESPFDFSPSRLAEERRHYGLDAAATVRLIGELESWGRAEIERAIDTGDGNRRDAVNQPDIEAMVEWVLGR